MQGGQAIKRLFAKFKYYILGFMAGLVNGFFGSGGGLLIVPMLSSQKIEQKKAHATSIAIILPMCVVSAAAYLIRGVRVELLPLGIFTVLGLLGALLGASLLKKSNNMLMRRIFGAIMIISAIRILLK